MSWAQSLIKLSTYEVETRQKRLADIRDRWAALQLKLELLDVERATEEAAALDYAQAGFYLVGFREGWKSRKAAVEAELRVLALEEQGAREALSEAFESQKKYEHVADRAAAVARAEAGKRETAALDELALRRRA